MSEMAQRVRHRFMASKTVYTGIFLDDASHAELARWWTHVVQIPMLDQHFLHHMTIKFKPSEAEVSALPLGSKVKIQVIGWAADDEGQAVLVKPPFPVDSAHPHVTVSTKAGVGPVYSGKLLQRGHQAVHGPVLEGIVDTWPRSHG